MPRQLTSDDFRQSLNDHVAARGVEIREKYGPRIGWSELLAILEDRSVVRYPCEIVFDAAPLLPGELAHPVCRGGLPEDGFRIHVRPCFQHQLSLVPWLVLYQLVLVNYGEFASPDDAETFGSNALGLPREDYYQALCELSDSIEAA